MKILELKFLAYGPFTDACIDLSCGSHGLHIIYGPNEAGKSSALRGLRHLLYGIPERSPDDFLHPYAKMRIAARICHSSGEELAFVRRKGRIHTLRAADDQTLLDETILRRFLNGVTAELFATLFGIDYDDLVRGGQEVVAGGGSLGQLVFAAGSGLSNLRLVQEQLRAEAELLFKPAAQKLRINEALSSLETIRKQLRDVQLPSQQWVKHDEALARAIQDKQAIEAELALVQRRANRLSRIQEALPIIARRREVLEELENCAGAVLLRDDFGQQRSDLTTGLRVAQNSRQQALKGIETIQAKLAGLPAADDLLANAELVEALYRELGSQHKAARDRGQLALRRDILRAEAKEILRSLRPDLPLAQAEALRLKKADMVLIIDLSSQYERITTRLNTSQEQVPKLKRLLGGLENQLQNFPAARPIEALAQAMGPATEYGALEKHCRTEQFEVASIQKDLEAALKRQGLWSGSLVALESLCLPSAESIGRYESSWEAAGRRVEGLTAEIQALDDRRSEILRQLEALQLEGEVPSEQDLTQAREKRDSGWHLIAAALEGQVPDERAVAAFVDEFAGSATLAAAYGASVRQADGVADRLRREADRVAVKARLLSEQKSSEKLAESLKKDRLAAAGQLADLEREWRRLWQGAGVMPLPPREMRVWTQEQKSLATKAGELRQRKEKAEALKADIEAQRRILERCLQELAEPAAAAGESLMQLLQRGRKLIELQEGLNQQRQRLLAERIQRREELAEARVRLESGQRELSDWQSQWQQALRPLGLGPGTIPAQAAAVLEDLKIFFDKLKEAETLEKRIIGIDRDTDSFGSRVADLAQNTAPDLCGQMPEHIGVELNSRLNRARVNRSQRQELQKQLRQEQAHAEEAGRRLAALETQLAGLCAEAGCESIEDLAEAERRSAQRRRLSTELTGLQDRLRQLGAGAGIEDFVSQALAVDPDGIEADIQGLAEKIETLARQKSELDQAIGSQRSELARMDGGAQAADLAEASQILLGRIESDVTHYARLKIAAAVLNRAIERYRDKNQGPILTRASELFANITGGSFQGIRAEFDRLEEAVLVGVRPGGRQTLGVGAMSDGTADQLYLALRLAGLEAYLGQNEPLPFIVDDILIKFDDARAAAALQALARLSAQTQIIFFTHHHHLLELARAHIDRDVLIEHELQIKI